MQSPLARYLESPDARIDRAALLLAKDADPTIDIEAWLTRFDELASPVAERLRAMRDPKVIAATLGTYLFDNLGFRGDEETYYDPRNSYLHQVVERKRGIPISLAAVMILVGERANVAIEGIGFPGHFLVHIGKADGVYVDPFFHGRVLDHGALQRLAQRTLGPSATLSGEHLRPASTRAMIVRMMANLKGIHQRENNHASALVICDRLADITQEPEHVRDRGMHALALASYTGAIADLQHYLEARPDAADAIEIRRTLKRAEDGAKLHRNS